MDANAPHLLIVEDERNIRELVHSQLLSEGYDCVSVADGRDALALTNDRPFDVIVLDLMLPGTDGLSLCRAIRKQGPNRDAPILILTARREEQDKLAGFADGADDYLTKPFSMKELSARVSALTRRGRRTSTDPLASARPLAIRGLHLDPTRRSLRVRGADVHVTPHEFRLLYRLASNPGQVSHASGCSPRFGRAKRSSPDEASTRSSGGCGGKSKRIQPRRPTSSPSGATGTSSPMASRASRSLYWRIAVGFILCIAGVLVLQAAIVFALLNRTELAGESLTQAASAALGQAMATRPQRDLQQFLDQEFPSPPRSLYAVLTTGQVLTAGGTRPSGRVVEAALREFEKKPVRSIPRGWQSDPFHASTIVVGGEIVGAVAVVPQTWPERLGPALLASSFGLLLAGTGLSSVFIFGPAHRRLKALESAAIRLGAGDLSVRAQDDGGDEVSRVARAFNQMVADLAASDRARRLLLADVSHELMTPLTAVRGYQERLAAEAAIRESASLSRSVAVIGDETLRVERIVGDLLDLAKLEGGGDSLDLQDVSVEGLFGRVAARHAPQAAAKALSINTSIAPGAEIVYGDRFRLEQAMQNLAANAVRHAPDGGHVELRAELRDSGTALIVTDDGPGIAPEHVAFILDRFYKGDPSRSGDSGGSGLGLSIVRAIVERHGGTVSVSSEPNAGTAFTIWLPAADLA